MNRVCRKVDSEYANCKKCGKKLTLRVLAYKHSKTCTAYVDRVAKRTAQAHERYWRESKRMENETVADTAANNENAEHDNAMTNTTEKI